MRFAGQLWHKQRRPDYAHLEASKIGQQAVIKAAAIAKAHATQVVGKRRQQHRVHRVQRDPRRICGRLPIAKFALFGGRVPRVQGQVALGLVASAGGQQLEIVLQSSKVGFAAHGAVGQHTPRTLGVQKVAQVGGHGWRVGGNAWARGKGPCPPLGFGGAGGR